VVGRQRGPQRVADGSASDHRAVFVNTAGTYGHVGVVTGIVNGTTFTTEEMNGGTVWTNRNQGITNEFGHYFPHTRNTGTTMRFI
jgi:surface antigen